MKAEQKVIAISLRKQGKSLNEISKILNVSKGSVSLWVKDVVLARQFKDVLNQRPKNKFSVEKRRSSRLNNEAKKRREIIRMAEIDAENLISNNLFLIGTMLYFAEGGKSQRGLVRFSNSDPRMIKIMMRYFKEVCKVDMSKFRGHIHMYNEDNINRNIQYWSEVSGIQKSQFFKTYCKPVSTKVLKRELPHGTFDIYVCDTRLFLQIQGWINSICKNQLNTLD